jgi:signal peptidase I
MNFDGNKNQSGVIVKSNQEGSASQSAALFVWDLIKILALALVIIVPFRMFIAEPFVVSGSSMLPNFHDSDYLIVDRISYRNEDPQRGDVIVLKFPKDNTQYFIKRIIGLPGEKVKLENGYVVIYNKENPQGLRLKESYLPTQGQTIGKSDTVTLGTDQYFVLGDNRTGSSDSRVWGILPRENIVGRTWLRILPAKSFGLIPHARY